MSDKDVSVSEQTRVRLPLLMLLSIVVTTALATVAWSAIKSDIAVISRATDDQELRMKDHELRLKELEKAQADIAVIKNDVRWLRIRAEREGNGNGQ